MLDEGGIRTIGERFAAALTRRIGTVVLILIVSLVVVSIPGYLLEWKWTGLPGTTDNGTKTLWHWLDLLIIPMVLAGSALWFRKVEEDIRREREKKEKAAEKGRRQEKLEVEQARRDAEASTAKLVEEQRAQEAALETYFNHMSELLLDRGDPLLESKSDSIYQEMAFVRTITALRRLDPNRRNLVFEFLRQARLLGLKREKIITNDAGNETTKPVEDPVSILERRNMQDIDLSKTNLSGANLRGTDLRKAKLMGADLRKAILANADLREADLSHTDLTGTDLSGADLSEAILYQAKLHATKLRHAILRESILIEAKMYKVRAPTTPNPNQPKGDQKDGWFDEAWGRVDLYHADLSGADLRGAYVEDATLNEAILRGADLQGAHLDGLVLEKANLSFAKLMGVDLSSTWMEEANLFCAKLIKTNLSKAHLSGANLREADLREADLSEADLGPKIWGSQLPAADLRDVKNLTCAQLKQAKNWEEAYRDEDLRCGADIPPPH